MTQPVRIQLSRKRGFNLMRHSIERNGLAAVNVARPGKWGNPYYPGCGIGYGGFDDQMRMVMPEPTPTVVVKWFRFRCEDMRKNQPKDFAAYIAPLKGCNLACWCKPGDPCHADVLLDLANRRRVE